MRSVLVTRTLAFLSLASVAALAAGCGGGSSSLPVHVAATATPTSQATTTPSTAQMAKATFVIKWPTTTGASSAAARSRSSSARHREYLSASTKSVTISVNNGTPTAVQNPNVSTTTTTPTTTVQVPAPVGSDTFAVKDYDTAQNLLASNMVPYTIVLDQANVVPITLNGNLAKIACAAVAPFVTGTAPAFDEVGPAGQLSVLPEDADGNIIVAPGEVPAVTLTAADATTGGVVASTSTPNVYTIAPLVVGTAVTYDASGTNLAGTTVTGTCNVTRELAMYVTNHFNNEVGSTQGSTAAQNASVTIYPASATGAATPTATIQGSNTQLASVQFVAVDPMGNIFVTNLGPQPGAPFGPTSGFVSIYGALSYGNVAPVATIPNLNTPEGIAFDKNGKLYVLSIDRIQEYPPSANGLTATAAATTTIAGGLTDLFSCYGLAVGADLTIATACSNVANVFPPNSSANASPGIVEVVGTTNMTYASDSWLGVSLDSAGNLALPGSNNHQDNVSVYSAASLPAPGATATPAPVTSTVTTDFNEPFGITTDPNGVYYVANYGNNTVATFTSVTTLEAGSGTSNALGGLNEPYGIAVR